MFQKDVHREGNIVPSMGSSIPERCTRKMCTERATYILAWEAVYQKDVPKKCAQRGQPISQPGKQCTRRMFQKDMHREGNIVPSLGTDVPEECSRKICTDRAT
jgi:hypothetical protein